MDRGLTKALIAFALLGLSAVGQQTSVTTATSPGGMTGTIPYFTIKYTIGNSVITQSGSNVGVGTTAPAELLDVMGNIVWGPGPERMSSGSTSLGFNRRVGDGYIYNPSVFAYQFQHMPATTAAADYLASLL